MKKIFGIILVIGLVMYTAYIFKYGGREAKPMTSIGGVKSALVNILADSEYVKAETTPNSYTTLCYKESLQSNFERIEKYGKDFKCFGDEDSFVAIAAYKKPVSEYTYYCVDSQNSRKELTKEQADKITTADTLCSQ